MIRLVSRVWCLRGALADLPEHAAERAGAEERGGEHQDREEAGLREQEPREGVAVPAHARKGGEARAAWLHNPFPLKAGEKVSFTLVFRVFQVVRSVF